MWQPIAEPFVAARIRIAQEVGCAISTTGKVACWGEVEQDDDSVAVAHRAGYSTPHVLAGIDGAIDVIHEWFYVCVAQRPEAGDGRCFLTNDIGRAPPRFPVPPVELATASSGICARMRDGSVGCVDLDGKFTAAPGIANASKLTCESGDGTCCAITPAGVKCFGDTPPTLPKLPTVTDLALFRTRGCARTATGGAVCWGYDEVTKLSRASGVRAVGATHDGDICLVLDDGTLACGNDRLDQTTNAVAIHDRCILHRDGAISCIGYNAHGELGDGSMTLAPAPVLVPKLDDMVALNVAHTNGCATKRDGSLWCWGAAGAVARGVAGGPFIAAQHLSGCRNTGSSIQCEAPMTNGGWDTETIVPKVGTIRAAAMHRDSSTCVVDGKGAVTCRHGMSEGGVDSRWVRLAAPGPVADLQPLSVGFCALHTDRRVSCFVDHRYDADDDFLDKLPNGKLTLVPGITDVTQLVTGQDEACVIKRDTTVWCWDADQPKPRELPTLKGASSLGSNDRHACAVLRGEVWCWGNGFMGQLGDGVGTGRISPAIQPIKAKTPFTAVKVGTGRDSTCALDDTGRVWCWGANSYGQLGHPHPQSAPGWSRVVGTGPR